MKTRPRLVQVEHGGAIGVTCECGVDHQSVFKPGCRTTRISCEACGFDAVYAIKPLQKEIDAEVERIFGKPGDPDAI